MKTLKAAGLVETLQSKGPFTVFTPTNNAFNALPAGTIPTLLKPESKSALTKVLTYHVVSGRWDATAIEKLIRKGGGTAKIKTFLRTDSHNRRQGALTSSGW